MEDMASVQATIERRMLPRIIDISSACRNQSMGVQKQIILTEQHGPDSRYRAGAYLTKENAIAAAVNENPSKLAMLIPPARWTGEFALPNPILNALCECLQRRSEPSALPARAQNAPKNHVLTVNPILAGVGGRDVKMHGGGHRNDAQRPHFLL
eukprot:2020609-Rhodomonas_salina.3